MSLKPPLNREKPTSTQILPRVALSNSGLLGGQLVVLVNIYRLPGITNPDIVNRASSQVPVIAKHVLGQAALLLLVLVL